MYTPGVAPGVVTSDISLTVAAEHSSVAVGAVNTGTAGQLIVASAPAALITGAVMSTTVMVWLAHVEVPQLFIQLA